MAGIVIGVATVNAVRSNGVAERVRALRIRAGL
jgi:hypothetical protein